MSWERYTTLLPHDEILEDYEIRDLPNASLHAICNFHLIYGTHGHLNPRFRISNSQSEKEAAPRTQ